MTEEELRQFLKSKGGTIEAIDAIVEQLSVRGVQRFYRENLKIVLSDAKAEEIASRNRAVFVEHIREDEGGSIPWDFIKNQLG